MKKIFSLITAFILICSLTGCNLINKPTPPPDNPSPPPEETENVEKPRKMLIDTADYKLSFDILGDWEEYAGTSEVRDFAQSVLYSTADTNSDNNVFFYILIDKYKSEENKSFKDIVVEAIKDTYDSVEFSSVSDSDNGNKVTAIYTLSSGTENIKNYQYSIINGEYQISFVYSSPSLIYDNQRGYINDMIQTAEFSATTSDTPA